MGIPLVPQLSNIVLIDKTRALVLIATAVVITSCVSSQTTKSVDDIFAAYSVDEILEAGNQSFDNEQFERAVFIYMQALEIEQNAETWYRIGIGKSRLGDKAYAWQALKKSVELDPNHAGSHQEIGLIDMGMGQSDQAKLHLVKATELDPTLWRAWNALGVIADIDHRYKEAVLYYQSGLIGAPNSSILMNNIGYSYYLAGDLLEATRWFGRAIMATPDYKPAVKNLALLYARQGWYDEAVKTFSKVVDKPQAYNDTGYIAMRNGDYWKASELFTEAIRRSPTYYEKAYENLENVEAALKEQGDDVSDTRDLNNISQVTFPDGQDTRTRTVLSPALNVRAGPSSDSKIVNYLRRGNEVEVIITLPNWAFVNYRPGKQQSNLTGWVNSDYLSDADKAAQPDKLMAAQQPATNQVTEEPGSETRASTASTDKPVVEKVSAQDESLVQPAQFRLVTEATQLTTPAEQYPAEIADTELEDESAIRSIDAVCNLGDQPQKTPHVAGSCIGVASVNADE